MKPDLYLLVDATPDNDAARRWQSANRIRRSGVGSQRSQLQYVMEDVGRLVTTEEPAYVARHRDSKSLDTPTVSGEDSHAIRGRPRPWQSEKRQPRNSGFKTKRCRRSDLVKCAGSRGVAPKPKAERKVIGVAARRIRGSHLGRTVAVTLSDHPRRACLPPES